MANQRHKLFSKARIADLLLFAFLVLTVEHNSFVLGQFENWPMLAWLLATGLDAGIAFAAFVATDKALIRSTRAISAIWLIGLLIVSYGLNVAHYAGKGAGDWKWELAAIFPVSLAFIGALKPGLLKVVMQAVTVQGQAQPIDPGLLSNIMAKLDRLGEQSGNLSETVEGLAGRFVEMEERTAWLETQPRNNEIAKVASVPFSRNNEIDRESEIRASFAKQRNSESEIAKQEMAPISFFRESETLTAKQRNNESEIAKQESTPISFFRESETLTAKAIEQSRNGHGAADGGGLEDSESEISIAALLEMPELVEVGAAKAKTAKSEKTPEKVAQIREWRAQEITWPEIGERLGITGKTAQNWIKD
jgi:hypothetical protein